MSAIPSMVTQRLSWLISSETDVKRVVALEPLAFEPIPGAEAEPRWVFLIETPFMTFPKFAVGTTNATNTDVVTLMTCGSEWAATDAFNAALEHGGVLPPSSGD